jgi:DNA repair ATPase RecN
MMEEIDVELTEEVENLIYITVKEYHDKKYNEMGCIYNNIKQEADSLSERIHEVYKRMNAIEEMIRSHSVGVQNVYDEMVKIRKLLTKTAELWK